MTRLAAIILTFWAVCCLGASLTSLAVFAAPGSRSSLLLPVCLMALSITFWWTGLALWRATPAASSRLRKAAVAVGPLLALAVWSTGAPGQMREALLAVLLGWMTFAFAAFWLAKRLMARHVTPRAS